MRGGEGKIGQDDTIHHSEILLIAARSFMQKAVFNLCFLRRHADRRTSLKKQRAVSCELLQGGNSIGERKKKRQYKAQRATEKKLSIAFVFYLYNNIENKSSK